MKTIKVNFYPAEEKVNAKKQVPVWVRSRHNTATLIRKATGHMISRGEWNAKKNCPKDSDLKNKLAALEKEIQDAYRDLSKENEGVTLVDVWDVIRPKAGTSAKPRSAKIVDWINHYVKSSPYSANYVRGCKAVQFHLTGRYMQGDKVKGKGKGFDPSLRFIDLNQSKIDALCKYMADNKKSTGTILRIVKHIRQLAKVAQDEGIRVGSLNFKAPKNYGGNKKVRTEVRLTFAEIRKIAALDLPDSAEKVVRDQFLLQCFTGLRWSDAANLICDNVHTDFLEIKQRKTGEVCCPTVGIYSESIIQTYKAKASSGTSKLFPSFTQEFFNRCIKIVAEKAGLTDKVKVTNYYGAVQETSEVRKCDVVKSHTGRRSFSRMLSLLGVSDAMISLEMGHLTESLTRHYIGTPEHGERIRAVQEAWRKAEEAFIPPLQVQRIIGVINAA